MLSLWHNQPACMSYIQQYAITRIQLKSFSTPLCRFLLMLRTRIREGLAPRCNHPAGVILQQLSCHNTLQGPAGGNSTMMWEYEVDVFDVDMVSSQP
jgi:hypothetical protein